jgi:hypothetical protein
VSPPRRVAVRAAAAECRLEILINPRRRQDREPIVR